MFFNNLIIYLVFTIQLFTYFNLITNIYLETPAIIK